jgi:hypothetical protein
MRRRKPGTRSYYTAKLDKAWGAAIHARGTCEVGTDCAGPLQAHHIFSRQLRRLRFDVRNGALLCARHHFLYAHQRPLEFADWLREHRPEDYDYLIEAAREIANYTPADLRDMLAEFEGLAEAA